MHTHTSNPEAGKTDPREAGCQRQTTEDQNAGHFVIGIPVNTR